MIALMKLLCWSGALVLAPPWSLIMSREIPPPLQYTPIEHDRDGLSLAMKNLEAQLDDELTPVVEGDSREDISVVTISLIYPIYVQEPCPCLPERARLFPTAYESERVHFTLVDGKTKQPSRPGLCLNMVMYMACANGTRRIS